VLDVPIQLDFREPRHGDIRDSLAAPSEFLQSLSIEPLALRPGLERTVEWVRAQI